MEWRSRVLRRKQVKSVERVTKALNRLNQDADRLKKHNDYMMRVLAKTLENGRRTGSIGDIEPAGV